MAETLFMRRTVGGLRPINRMGEDALAKYPLNTEIKAEITQPRNLGHHKKFFALLQALFPHQEIYPTLDSFRAAMTCALGYGETVTLKDGRIVLVPGSISFAKMDQAAFNDFYDRALELIATRILPGIGREDVDREVAEIIDGRVAA
jgi:hypothetical protein